MCLVVQELWFLVLNVSLFHTGPESHELKIFGFVAEAYSVRGDLN